MAAVQAVHALLAGQAGDNGDGVAGLTQIVYTIWVQSTKTWWLATHHEGWMVGLLMLRGVRVAGWLARV